MAAHFGHVFGDQDSATVERVPDLLAELDQSDQEHTDVSVEHESGWVLSAYRDGLVVWENVEDDQESGRLYNVPREEVVRLFTALVEGDVALVAAQPWEGRRP